MDIENKIRELEEKFNKMEELEKQIFINSDKIKSNKNDINDNANQIQQNTGALEILKTFKADSNKFFIMWLITFIAFLISLGCIIFLLHK